MVVAVAAAAGAWHASVEPEAASVAVVSSAAAAAESEAALAGVWWLHEPGVSGDPVRFYYFHGDGTGLYRYGVVGHSYTHSFDYAVDGTRLSLHFRKTGAAHDTQFSVEYGGAGERDWLTFTEDARESAGARYYRVPGDEGMREQTEVALDPASDGPPPAGHMWIDLQSFATGGQGFYFYQLRPAGIDGRGVGWFHRGDFDDWSTESLTYRIAEGPARLEIHFDVVGTTATTPLTLAGSQRQRTLTLQADPRDFGQTHVYKDAGRSFGTATALDAAGLDPRLAAVVTRF